MENITRALPKLMGRLKLATSRASRCFLVALFIFGFTSSYFANPPSKTHPQNSATPDVENHPPKPAIVLVHGAFADASGSDHVVRLLEQDGRTVTAVQSPRISFADDQTGYRCTKRSDCGCATLIWRRGH